MDNKTTTQNQINNQISIKTQSKSISIKYHYNHVNKICEENSKKIPVNEYGLEQGHYFPIQNSPNKFMTTLEKRLHQYYNIDINLSISN